MKQDLQRTEEAKKAEEEKQVYEAQMEEDLKRAGEAKKAEVTKSAKERQARRADDAARSILSCL